MASHQVAIAKASFAAGLLRPDPVSVNRDEIARFHTLLEQAAARCSPLDIQSCKIWLLDNIVPSPGRITALAKYLVALSASYGAGDDKPEPPNGAKPRKATSPKRKRLHLLYLLNDLLHHTKYHTDGSVSRHTSFASNLQPHLVNLFNSAASFDSAKNTRHHAKLMDLVNLWGQHGFLGAQFVESLRQTVRTAGAATGSSESLAFGEGQDGAGNAEPNRSSKDTPFVMPASHGDASTPYYDLPAGNLMPHIVPNSSMPINPELVKPLQFVAGPAEESLANVVRDFLRDVEGIYGPQGPEADEGVVVDIDELGQPLVKDEATGDLVAKEAYYGWSIAFCERMKKRKRGRSESNRRDGGGGSSRTSSRSSRSPKRRRHSPSRSSRSSHSMDRRRSVSQSRSRSRDARRDRQHSPHRSRSQHGQSPSPARESIPRPPPRPAPPPIQATHSRPASNQALVTPADQIDNPFATAMPAAPTAPNARAFEHNFPLGPGGLPIPPPPPFHQGPWPPPPPPPALPAGASFRPGQYPNFSTAPFSPGNFVPPPPPGWRGHEQLLDPNYGQGSPPAPPPPPALGPGWQEGYGQSGSQGRGYGQDHWNSRGGSSRGGGGNWSRSQDQYRR